MMQATDGTQQCQKCAIQGLTTDYIFEYAWGRSRRMITLFEISDLIAISVHDERLLAKSLEPDDAANNNARTIEQKLEKERIYVARALRLFRNSQYWDLGNASDDSRGFFKVILMSLEKSYDFSSEIVLHRHVKRVWRCNSTLSQTR